MAKGGSYKPVTTEYSVADAIANGYSELQSLRDEMQEIVDNMSGANMEHLPKYETANEACDTLGNFCDDEPEVPEEAGAGRIQVTEMVNKRKGRGPSRSVRCGNAVSMLEAAKAHLETLQEAAEEGEGEKEAGDDDFQTLIDKLEEDIGEAEGVEFPGMYG